MRPHPGSSPTLSGRRAYAARAQPPHRVHAEGSTKPREPWTTTGTPTKLWTAGSVWQRKRCRPPKKPRRPRGRGRRRRTSEAAPGIRPGGPRAADRASRRDEFDPRHSLAAVEALAERARGHRKALQNDIPARDALPDERYATEGALVRARETLEEYRGAHERALGEFGQAALGEVPNPGELSSSLLEAQGCMDRADRAASSGRFSEARSLLQEAADLARNTMRSPSRLKTAMAEADRKKREGEEKLQELEARLAQAKANEHLMDPYQRQKLREYEYQLENARYGFFGGDWLTALLLFEALDNDYMSLGDPSSFDAGEFGQRLGRW